MIEGRQTISYEPLPPHPASPAYYHKCEHAAKKWKKVALEYPTARYAADWWERERLRVLDELNALGWVDLGAEEEGRDEQPQWERD